MDVCGESFFILFLSIEKGNLFNVPNVPKIPSRKKTEEDRRVHLEGIKKLGMPRGY
jgi:hypothetical protein